jgi:hypothetical protein
MWLLLCHVLSITADCDVRYKISLQCGISLVVGILTLSLTICKNSSNDSVATSQMLHICLPYTPIQLIIGFIFIAIWKCSITLSHGSAMHLEFFYLHQKRVPCVKPTYFLEVYFDMLSQNKEYLNWSVCTCPYDSAARSERLWLWYFVHIIALTSFRTNTGFTNTLWASKIEDVVLIFWSGN